MPEPLNEQAAGAEAAKRLKGLGRATVGQRTAESERPKASLEAGQRSTRG